MAEHENLGCPSNAKCSKKTGLIRHQWIEIAKSKSKNKLSKMKSFSKSFGVPLSIWGLNKAESNPKYMIWDSPCKNHNLEEKPRVSLVDVFSKNLNKLESNSDVIIPRGVLLNNGKTEVINLLRSDAPILLSKDSVFYVRESEGTYYSIAIRRDGHVTLLDTPSLKKYPSEVSCPKELSEKFNSTVKLDNLYLGHFCKRIWNIDQNAYQTIALGWSCN
jgi:hypothetical protein